MKIQIRPYDTDDLSILSKIYTDSRTETFHWIAKENFSLDDFARDTAEEKILLLTVDSKIAGFVSIWMPDNFIHHLYIDSQFQGRGLGKQLLDEALKMMGRPARLKCVVKNANACHFYERNGWTIESTASDGPMGPYHNYVLI